MHFVECLFLDSKVKSNFRSIAPNEPNRTPDTFVFLNFPSSVFKIVSMKHLRKRNRQCDATSKIAKLKISRLSY